MHRKILSTLFVFLASVAFSQKDSSGKWEYGFYGGYGSISYDNVKPIKYAYSQRVNTGFYVQLNTKFIGLRAFTSMGIIDFNLKTLNNNPFYYYRDTALYTAQYSDLHNHTDAKNYRVINEAERGRVYQKFNYLDCNFGLGIIFFRNLWFSPLVETSFSYYYLINKKGVEKYNYNPEVQLYSQYKPIGTYDGSKLYSYDKRMFDLWTYFGLQYNRKRFTMAVLIDANFINFRSYDQSYMEQEYRYHAISGLSTGISSVYYKTLYLRVNYNIRKKS